MGKLVLLSVICLGLAACATASDYVPVTSAASPYGVTDAYNNCTVQSDNAPFMVNAMGSPLEAAAEQAQFVIDCMRAKGYAQQ
ncbi:MAG: hypothetical protein ACP5QR_04935 [Rhizomicrobium sp.]